VAFLKVSFWQKIKKNNFLVYFLVALAIFLLDFWVVFQPLKNAFGWISRPLRGSVYQWSKQISPDQILFSRKIVQLNQEKEALEKEVAKLTGELARLQYLGDENKRLKSLINFFPEEIDFLPTKIIGHSRDYLIINRGKKDNIFVGQLLISDRHLVGQVMEVYKEEAKVIKLGSGLLELPVLIFSDRPECLDKPLSCQKGRGIMTGQTVEEILREEEVLVGDLVILLDGPMGILVGKVSRVKETLDEVFKQAQIEKLIEPNHLVEAFLVFN
jgi:rod shape-determining protein MreC